MKTSPAQSVRQSTDDVGALVQRYGMSRFAYHTWQFPGADPAGASRAGAPDPSRPVSPPVKAAAAPESPAPPKQVSAPGPTPTPTARATAAGVPVFSEQRAISKPQTKPAGPLPTPVPVSAAPVPASAAPVPTYAAPVPASAAPGQKRGAAVGGPLLSAPPPLIPTGGQRQAVPSAGGRGAPAGAALPAPPPVSSMSAGKGGSSGPSAPTSNAALSPWKGPQYVPQPPVPVPWETPEDLVGRELPLLLGMRDVSPWIFSLKLRSSQRFEPAVAVLAQAQEATLLPPLEPLEVSLGSKELTVRVGPQQVGPEGVLPGAPRPPLSREAVARLDASVETSVNTSMRPPSSPVKVSQLGAVQAEVGGSASVVAAPQRVSSQAGGAALGQNPSGSGWNASPTTSPMTHPHVSPITPPAATHGTGPVAAQAGVGPGYAHVASSPTKLPPLPPPPQTLRGPAVVADPMQARNGAVTWGQGPGPVLPPAPPTIRVATGLTHVNGMVTHTPPAPSPAREDSFSSGETGGLMRGLGSGKAPAPAPMSPAGNARDALRLLALKG